MSWEASVSLALGPWGQSSAKRKADRSNLCWTLPHHKRAFLSGFAVGDSIELTCSYLHSGDIFGMGPVSSFSGCWPEAIHANVCSGGMLCSGFPTAGCPPLWSINAQNFCSIPRGPPIKMILHSLPANRTCTWAKRSSRLSIIMNSEWNGVVRYCFSWKTYFFSYWNSHKEVLNGPWSLYI